MKNTENRAILMGIAFAAIGAFMPAFFDFFKKLLTALSFALTQGQSKPIDISLENAIFASLYILLVICCSYKGYAWEKSNNLVLSKKAKALDNKIEENNKNGQYIIQYLHTMPPQKYLAQFEGTYIGLRVFLSEINEIHNATSQKKDIELIRKSINKVEEKIKKMNELFIIITKQWDTQGTVFDSDIEYRVNIMAFCQASKAVDMFRAGEFDWAYSKRFFMAVDPEGLLTDIDGVLFVDKNLDVHYKDNEAVSLSDERTPIALPVTLSNTASSYNDQNLPGASKAFSTEEAQYIGCCKEAIHEEIKMMDHISDFMKRELRKYYCEGNFAQSIISFPMQRAGEKSFGVINVYRNKSHLAKRNEKDFMALVKPLVITISEAMFTLYSMRAEFETLKNERREVC